MSDDNTISYASPKSSGRRKHAAILSVSGVLVLLSLAAFVWLVTRPETPAPAPVLSKIPGLERLFTNRSFVRDEQTLQVDPKIIQNYQETQRSFVNYDTPSNLPQLGGSINHPSVTIAAGAAVPPTVP